MRPIIFRAKRTGSGINAGKWVHGSLIHSLNGEFMYGYQARCQVPVDPATVGQYTGMKDRNGNEVYEGDILMVEGIKYPRYHIVSWDERKFMFCIDETPLYAYLHGDTLLREYVVCGNVFDNHELLEINKDKITNKKIFNE